MNQKPQQRRGLGRGLGSLIPTAPAPAQVQGTPEARSAPETAFDGADARREHEQSRPDAAADDGGAAGDGSRERAPLAVAGAYFAELPVTQITPNPRQPRQV